MKTRGDFVRELLRIWDDSAKILGDADPQLAREHEIAVSWLMLAWTTKELDEPIKEGVDRDGSAGASDRA
jgi:hypothetical protein